MYDHLRRHRVITAVSLTASAWVFSFVGVNVLDSGPVQAQSAVPSTIPTSSTIPSTTTSLVTTTTTELPTTTTIAHVATTDPANTLKVFIATRSDTASVAVYDTQTGRTFTAGETSTTYDAASVAKLTILIGLLEKAQTENRGLTANESTLAKQMIDVSDNNAADALWSEIGGQQGFRAVLTKIGTKSTTPVDNTDWGLSQTSAADQTLVMQTVVVPNTILTNASRTIAEGLLASVVSSQHWGVSAADSSALLKNGWLERTAGWDVNSVGIVKNRYIVAVMTKNNSTEQYGIDTIQQMSKLAVS